MSAKLHMSFLRLACLLLCSRSLCAEDDGIDEALGMEIIADDCELFAPGGQSCENPSFLQTAASYQRALQGSEAPLETIQSPPAFFQTGLDEGEVHSSFEFGEVHTSNGERVEDAQSSLGEVHASDGSNHTVSRRSEHVAEVLEAVRPSSSIEVVEVTDASKPLIYDSGAFESYISGHPHMIMAAFIAFPLLGTLLGLAVACLCPAHGSSLAGLSDSCCSVLQQKPKFHVSAGQAAVESNKALPIPESSTATRSDKLPDQATMFRQQVREVLQEAAFLTVDNVEELLPARGGYDTAFSKPVSSGRPVLLKARIEGPLAGGPGPLGLAEAPLTKRSCVYYSAAAVQPEVVDAPDMPQRQEAQEGVEFQVSLVGAPQIRVDVRGHDLKLIDMREGHYSTSQAFESSPEHWQAFLLDDKMKPYATLPAEQQQRLQLRQRMAGRVIDFQESVLLVGSQFSLVGELLRDASGRLSLQPWPLDKRKAQDKAAEMWRTSWECVGSDFGAVLASDDPSFSLESLKDHGNSGDAAQTLNDLVGRPSPEDPFMDCQLFRGS